MNMELTPAEARHALDALDFSAENSRFAEINAQLAQIDEARKAADARLQAVLLLLRPLTGDAGSVPRLTDGAGSSVAHALLAGVRPTDAAATMVDRAQLEHEPDALKEGMGELARRERALLDERREITPKVGRRILADLQRLCDQLESEAREAAKVIERAFAGLSAIGRATRAQPVALQMTAAAVAGLRGGSGSGLLRANDSVDVPTEITDLLTILAEKGPAYGGGRPTTVQVHDRHVAAALGPILRGTRAAVG